MNEQRTFTPDQKKIVDELVGAHQIDPSDVSFDGDDLTPIFSYEAVCLLSLKLTDIRHIDCAIAPWRDDKFATVSCTVVLPDSRSRTTQGTAQVNEPFYDGSTVENYSQACMLAQARAVRCGLRSVGINLWRAHKAFMETGNPVAAHTNDDPRSPLYREVHVLGTEIGLIVDGDKTGYQQFLAESYDGRQSAKDLDDVELQRLLVQFRAMARVQRAFVRQAA